MIKVTIEASNVAEAKDFLEKHFDLSKMGGFVVTPNKNAGFDVMFYFAYSKERFNINVKKGFSILKNSEGATALREIAEKAGFSKSKLDEIFSITKIEKIGVVK